MKTTLPPILAEAYADRDRLLRNGISTDQEAAATTKRCSRCGQIKVRADFSTHTTSKDGLQAQCHSCRRKAYHERQAKLKAKRRGTK